MSTSKDLYQVLEIPTDADDVTLKKAYRRLAKRYHPDLNKGSADAEERFKEVAYAHQVLSDPEKRRLYDQFGHDGLVEGFDPKTYEHASSWQGFTGNANAGAGAGVNFGDLLGGLFSHMAAGGPMPGGFASGFAKAPASQPAEDIDLKQKVSLRDVAAGTSVEVRYPRRTQCKRCYGQGAEPGSQARVCGVCNGLGRNKLSHGSVLSGQPCHSCNGTGRRIETVCRKCAGVGVTQEEQILKVRIPQGARDQGRVRVRGKGHVDKNGQCGDLLVRLEVHNDTQFERRGDDLYVTLPIPIPEAVLGAVIDVPTLTGSLKMTIPPGTDANRRLRLKGKGMPKRDQIAGDLYVSVQIVVPRHIDKLSQGLIEHFAELNPQNPRE